MKDLFIKGENGGRVHLADWGGEGEPLLLLHGMGAHTHWWDPVVPLLSGFRPVAMDMRGHGDSEHADRYTMSGYVHDLEYVRRALGWSDMYLAGHSLGARVCLQYAKAYPNRVRKLAILDFLAAVREKDEKYERKRKRRQPTYSDSEMMTKRFKLQPPGTALSRTQLERLAGHGIRKLPGGRWTWKFDWKAFYFEYTPVWREIGRIEVPTLVLRGEHSTVMPDPDFKAVVSALPDAVGDTLPGTYHHITLDDPEGVARRLGDFFTSRTEDASPGKRRTPPFPHPTSAPQ